MKILIILAERHLGRKTLDFALTIKVSDGIKFTLEETKYGSVHETILNFCTKYMHETSDLD